LTSPAPKNLAWSITPIFLAGQAVSTRLPNPIINCTGKGHLAAATLPWAQDLTLAHRQFWTAITIKVYMSKALKGTCIPKSTKLMNGHANMRQYA
jgi:hypothetical protein